MTVTIRNGKIHFLQWNFIFKYMCDTTLRVNMSIRYKMKSPNMKKKILLGVIRTDFWSFTESSLIQEDLYTFTIYILMNLDSCAYPNATTTFKVLNIAIISKKSPCVLLCMCVSCGKKWFLKITIIYQNIACAKIKWIHNKIQKWYENNQTQILVNVWAIFVHWMLNCILLYLNTYHTI